MLASDKQIEDRLNNPMNLMNRMSSLREGASKRQSAMGLFGVNRGNTAPIIAAHSSSTLNQGTLNQGTLNDATTPFQNPFAKLETPQALIPANVTTAPQQEVQSVSLSIPTVDNILDDSQAKIKLGLAHDAAIGLLQESITKLRGDLDRVDTEKLPSVINAAGKVIEGIRKERLEVAKSGKDRDVHFHFYTPTQRKVEEFETIDV